MLPHAIEISKERNRYIHDQWIFWEDKISQGRIGRMKMNPTSTGYYWEEQTLTIEELYQFLGEIGQLQKQISGFLENLPRQTF